MFVKKMLILLLVLCCEYSMGAMPVTIPVEGTLFGRPFHANVDHELAKTMLANRSDSSVVQQLSSYNTRKLNTETLSEISQKYSADVSTLFFVEKIYGQEKNRQAQDYYMSAIDSLLNGHVEQQLSFLQGYFIVFVPGFRYKLVSNGGNFLNQRLLLDSIGIPYEMVDIDEAGLVEDNAKVVADRLRVLSKQHRNIIVISVSKGGLETAIALGKLVNPKDITSVKAWINVGGILKGTPVADVWRPWHMRFWLSCGLFFIRQKANLKALTNDLSYNRCKEVYKVLKIPAAMLTVNLVAASLGQQKKNTKIPTPNDGFSPLADAIAEDGVVVVEMGVDHFFKNVDLNTRMLALLRYIDSCLKKEKQ